MNEGDPPPGIDPQPPFGLGPIAVEEVGKAGTVVKGSALLFTAQITGNAGFFVAVLLVTRTLSIPHRGQFAFITTAAQMIALVASLGVPEAMVVFAAREPKHRGQLLTNALLFTGLSTAVTSGVFCTILVLLHESRPRGMTGLGLVLLATGAVLSALAYSGNTFLTGCRRWRAQAIASAASPWLYALLLALVSTQTKLTVDRSLGVWVAYYTIWTAALIIPAVRTSPLGRPSPALLGRSLRFGVRAWAGSVTQMLNYRMDQLLMGFIATQVALGIYVVAVNASEILLILPQAAATALLPALAQSFEKTRKESTLQAFRVLGVISLAAMAAFAALGSVLLPIVFGARYQASVTPFLWLVAGTIGFVASIVFTAGLMASASPGLASVAPVVSLVVGLGLDLALIPSLGATGAAMAAMAGFFVGGLVALLSYRAREPFPYRLLVPTRADLVLTRLALMHLVPSARTRE